MIAAASDAVWPRGGMLPAPAFIIAAFTVFESVRILSRRGRRRVAGLVALRAERSGDA